ncbi:MAG: 23S rRNA (adenine(2030)-N(6))-methyltransferase RlmJ [Stenotrophobium sp.]
MHYRHSYHAGNFADVFKHVLLCGLLAALNRKDKPWCYVDTHAGSGFYDLGSEGAARTGEWREGVARMMVLQDVPPPLAIYLDAVRAANPEGAWLSSPDSASAASASSAHQSGRLPSPPVARALDLPASSAQQGVRLPSPPAAQALDALASSARKAGRLTYPGSPAFAQAAARATDRLLLCEKVPEVALDLRAVFARDARVAVHQRDGYEAHALLPPAEKRGLMLVDPPFERGDELDAMAELSLKSLSRFAGGIQALWYPVKNRHVVSGFLRRMGREATRPTLNFEFDTGAPREAEVSAAGITKHPLRGCGLLVVNPPFRFAQEMEPSLNLIARTLAQGPDAHCTATWIRSE